MWSCLVQHSAGFGPLRKPPAFHSCCKRSTRPTARLARTRPRRRRKGVKLAAAPRVQPRADGTHGVFDLQDAHLELGDRRSPLQIEFLLSPFCENLASDIRLLRSVLECSPVRLASRTYQQWHRRRFPELTQVRKREWRLSWAAEGLPIARPDLASRLRFVANPQLKCIEAIRPAEGFVRVKPGRSLCRRNPQHSRKPLGRPSQPNAATSRRASLKGASSNPWRPR